MEQLHEEECISSKDSMIGSLIIVPVSMQNGSDFAHGMQKGGSLENVLSLTNWNVVSNNSIEIYSPGLDIIPLHRTLQASAG